MSHPDCSFGQVKIDVFRLEPILAGDPLPLDVNPSDECRAVVVAVVSQLDSRRRDVKNGMALSELKAHRWGRRVAGVVTKNAWLTAWRIVRDSLNTEALE